MSDKELLVRVGKKRALYIPADVARAIDIEEGDLLILQVKENSIILKPVRRLLISRKKWAETTIEDFEAESEELTKAIEDD